MILLAIVYIKSDIEYSHWESGYIYCNPTDYSAKQRTEYPTFLVRYDTVLNEVGSS